MIAVRTRPLSGAQPAWRSYAPALVRVALLAAIGVELAVLAAWLPDTLRALWRGDPRDFHNLYEPARHLDLVGLYSPALSLLLFPVALLGEHVAYRIVFCANAASAVAIAYVAQRAVRSAEARVAAALAVLSLPELHWALRLGHITPMLALAAMVGFVLASRRTRRTRLAGAALSLLLLKPQTAVAPFLFLAVRRQFAALAAMLGAAAAAATAAFAVIGPGSIATFLSDYLNWGPHSTENLLPVQQAWMYSWPGFLVSLGVHPNPLLTADLLLLSAGVTAVAVARLDARTAAAAGALAMILLTPYSQFYDACLVAVAFALILRAPLRPHVAGALVAMLYAAAVVTQANTHFPVRDVLGPAETGGLYWLTPMLLAAIAALALFGPRAAPAQEARDGR